MSKNTPKFKAGQIVRIVNTDLVGVVTVVIDSNTFWYNYSEEEIRSSKVRSLYEVKFGKEYIKDKFNNIRIYNENDLELYTKPVFQLETPNSLESWLSSSAERSIKTDRQLRKNKLKLNHLRNTKNVRMDGR